MSEENSGAPRDSEPAKPQQPEGSEQTQPHEEKPEAPGGAGEAAQSAQPQGGAQQPQPQQEAWWYATGGKSYGPISEQQLIALARAGYFRKTDYVFAGYIGTWVRADSVHGLFEDVGAGAGTSAPPGPPPFVEAPPEGAPPMAVAYTRYAGFWIRVLAVMIDGLIVGGTFCLLFALTVIPLRGMSAASRSVGGSPPSPLGDGDAGRVIMMLVIYGVSFGASWLYFALMESSRWQATLGKRAVGIMVTDREGRRISFARATGRYFGSLISSMTCNIGYIMGAFTERKQTLHDLLAETFVVHGRSNDPGARFDRPASG